EGRAGGGAQRGRAEVSHVGLRGRRRLGEERGRRDGDDQTRKAARESHARQEFEAQGGGKRNPGRLVLAVTLGRLRRRCRRWSQVQGANVERRVRRGDDRKGALRAEWKGVAGGDKGATEPRVSDFRLQVSSFRPQVEGAKVERRVRCAKRTRVAVAASPLSHVEGQRWKVAGHPPPTERRRRWSQ